MIGESSFQSASRSAVPVSWRCLLLTALVLPLAALPLGCATPERTFDGQSSDTAVTTPTSPSATVPTPGPGSATSGPDAPSADNPGAMTAGSSDSSAPVTPSTPVSPSTPVTPITPVDTATSTGGGTAVGGGSGQPSGSASSAGGSGGVPAQGSAGSPVAAAGQPALGAGGDSGDAGAGSAMGGSAGAMSASGGAAGTGGASGGSAGQSGTGDAVPSPGCGQMRTLGDGNHTMMSGGQNREYHIKAPSDYDNTRPYRLIFMFHWFYGSIDAVVNPPDADHNTDDPYYGLEDLAGDSSIFVVPQGLNDSGGAGWSNPNNRDVNFTDDMLEAVSNDLCIDTSRVFTMGFSFGGAISYKLACVRPDKFRAVLVYDTGPVSGNNAAECTSPIPFFQTHGVDDQTFNYQTGLSVLDIFTGTNGCTAMTPQMAPQDGHVCTQFEGCTPGYPVRFCDFGAGENNPYNPDLHGHYPTAKDPGQSKSWIPGEAWDFISQF
jgi:poly(3-hydroxybutyrate) depolymerase